MYEYKPIDHDAIREKIASVDTYWERQPTDVPGTLNSFDGTFAFSDHTLIPEALRNFIFEHFPKHERFRTIPLDEINTIMNDAWEGPGSMVKINRLYQEMRAARRDGAESDKGLGDVKTMDDYNEAEFTSYVREPESDQ